jgi:hypothetical protein
MSVRRGDGVMFSEGARLTVRAVEQEARHDERVGTMTQAFRRSDGGAGVKERASLIGPSETGPIENPPVRSRSSSRHSPLPVLALSPTCYSDVPIEAVNLVARRSAHRASALTSEVPSPCHTESQMVTDPRSLSCRYDDVIRHAFRERRTWLWKRTQRLRTHATGDVNRVPPQTLSKSPSCVIAGTGSVAHRCTSPSVDDRRKLRRHPR